jgi:photosystem II stability/assembly factor-like uncharacterized protein
LLTSDQGWLLTDRYLLWTNDGGSTWLDITPQPVAGSKRLRGAFFLDPRHGWLVAATPDRPNTSRTMTVFRTQDGGTSWRTSTLPPLPSGGTIPYSYGVANLTFVDSQHGSARLSVAGEGNQYLIIDPAPMPTFATTDGGRSWTAAPPDYPPVPIANLPVPPAYRPDTANEGVVVFVSPTEAVLPVTFYTDTTSAIVFFISEDAGTTWRPGASLPDPNRFPVGQDQGIMNSVAMQAWAVLFRDRIEVTGDQGRTWNTVRPTGFELLNTIDFGTPDVAWGLGTYRVCPGSAQTCFKEGPMRSRDGGRSWSPLPL